MKIKEYDTDELLLIANNVTGEYTDRQRGTSHGGRYGAIAKRPVSVTGRNVQTLLQIT